MKTRKQYLNKECSHREYYAQFVDDGQKRMVVQVISKKKLLTLTDEHLNDIGLDTWDRIGLSYSSSCKLKEAGDGFTLAGAVCINKEAARQIIEANGQEA